MRKLLIGVVVVLLLAIVAVAGFLFVPSPLQKWAVERGASIAAGRQVTFGEPFRLRAWPPVTITAADIRVANADWARQTRWRRSRRSMPASTSWPSGAITGSRSIG